MISDADLEMAVPVPKPTKKDPFAIGWRWRENGRPSVEPIPLTQADLLDQEEDDQIEPKDAHSLVS